MQKLGAVLISCLIFLSYYAVASDATSVAVAPTISILKVSPGSACTRKGEIAETINGSYATCEGGLWTGRAISNPVYVYKQSGLLVGQAGLSAFAECPSNKKVIFSSCGLVGASGSGLHFDEVGPAGGAYQDFPLEGDKGAFCLYVAQPGSRAYVVAAAVCGDR